jgi:hypothetical protein
MRQREQGLSGRGQRRIARPRRVEHVSRVNHQVNIVLAGQRDHTPIARNEVIAAASPIAPWPSGRIGPDMRASQMQDANGTRHD